MALQAAAGTKIQIPQRAKQTPRHPNGRAPPPSPFQGQAAPPQAAWPQPKARRSVEPRGKKGPKQKQGAVSYPTSFMHSPPQPPLWQGPKYYAHHCPNISGLRGLLHRIAVEEPDQSLFWEWSPFPLPLMRAITMPTDWRSPGSQS